MKKSIYVVLLIMLFGSGLFAQQADQKKYESLWEGKLKVSGVTLRLVLKIFKNGDGSLGAVLNSPDQTKQDLPVSSVSLTDDSLKFESTMLMASYAGKINKDSMISVGKFTQRGSAFDLTLKKVEKLTDIPEKYKKSGGYFLWKDESGLFIAFPDKPVPPKSFFRNLVASQMLKSDITDWSKLPSNKGYMEQASQQIKEVKEKWVKT